MEAKFEHLREEVENTQAVFNEWKETMHRNIVDSHAWHCDNMAKNKENVDTLKATLEHLSAQKASLSRVVSQRQEEENTMKAEIVELQEQERALNERNTTMNNDVVKLMSTLEKEQQAVTAQKKALHLRLEEITKGADLYKTRLGLSFENSNGQLQLTFTHIDPADWTRPFLFAVSIDDENKYILEACEPMLEGLPAMIDELNVSNNFSSFVKAIRRKFKDSY